MTFSILVFLWRKDGLTPAQFQDYYDNTHLPLVKSLTATSFPLTHTRHYIGRTDDATAGYPARAVVGAPSDFEYDVVAELTWASEDEYKQFRTTVARPENWARIGADEQRFISADRPMRVVVKGATSVMTRS